MAKGTTTSTAQIRRPGRSVRSTHQAARVPMTAHSTVTTTVRRTVFHNSVPVSGRKIRWTTVDQPAPLASITRNTSGTSRTTATAALAARSTGGRRAPRPPPGYRSSGEVPGRPSSSGTPSPGAHAHQGSDRPAPASEQPRLLQQGYRRRAVAELRDGDGVRLQQVERRLGL